MIKKTVLLLLLIPVNALSEPLFKYSDITTTQATPLVYTIKHADIQDLATILNSEYPNYALYKKHKENQLVIFIPKEKHQEFKTLLRKLDTPELIVPLQVNVHEVSYSNSNEFQSLLSNLGNGIQSNIDINKGTLTLPTSIQGTLKALEAKGQATIIANPSIQVLNNHTASLHIGDQIPYISSITQSTTQTISIQRVNTGIALDITPYMSPSKELFLDINLTVSAVKVWKPIGDLEYPVLSNRKFNTRIKFKPTETLIISGLTQSETQETSQKVPVIGSIPIIGWLFKSKKKETLHSDIIIQVQYRDLKQPTR